MVNTLKFYFISLNKKVFGLCGIQLSNSKQQIKLSKIPMSPKKKTLASHIMTLRAGPHMVPSHLSSIHAISTVENMEVGFYHFTWGSQVLSPNYDMDVYMATLFGGEAWDLC